MCPSQGQRLCRLPLALGLQPHVLIFLSEACLTRSLKVSRPVVLHGRFPVEDPMKGLSELRTKNGVNDGIQRRVEAAHPPKEGDEV